MKKAKKETAPEDQNKRGDAAAVRNLKRTTADKFGTPLLEELLTEYWNSGVFAEDFYSVPSKVRLPIAQRLINLLVSKTKHEVQPDEDPTGFSEFLRGLAEEHGEV